MYKKLGDLLNFNQGPSGRKTGVKSRRETTPSKKTLSNGLNFLTLINEWEKIVGPKLAEKTIPLKNQNKTLTILTHHPAYSQQLSFMEESLKEKIYQNFPQTKSQIKRLNFVASTGHFEREKELIQKKSSALNLPTSDSPKKKKFHPYDPKFKALKNEAELEYAEVEDSDLKESLISLYIQSKMKENS